MLNWHSIRSYRKCFIFFPISNRIHIIIFIFLLQFKFFRFECDNFTDKCLIFKISCESAAMPSISCDSNIKRQPHSVFFDIVCVCMCILNLFIHKVLSIYVCICIGVSLLYQMLKILNISYIEYSTNFYDFAQCDVLLLLLLRLCYNKIGHRICWICIHIQNLIFSLSLQLNPATYMCLCYIKSWFGLHT